MYPWLEIQFHASCLTVRLTPMSCLCAIACARVQAAAKASAEEKKKFQDEVRGSLAWLAVCSLLCLFCVLLLLCCDHPVCFFRPTMLLLALRSYEPWVCSYFLFSSFSHSSRT